jgi:hypothetical protein
VGGNGIRALDLVAHSSTIIGNTLGMEERSTAPMGLDLARLRRGEITAFCGALLVLLGLLVPPWYEASHATLEAGGGPGGTIPASFGAWSGAGWLGTILNLVILAAALFAIGTAVAGARGLEWDGSGNRMLALSLAAVIAVVLRMIFTPTSLSGYRFETGLRLGIFVTLVGALVVAWGAWRRRLPSRSRPD